MKRSFHLSGTACTPRHARCGFTLAEVLITLGIIGVVAALTIPSLFTKVQENILVNRLRQTYSIFSQAYKLSVVNNDSPEGWEIGTFNKPEGADKLYEYFKPYLKISHECDINNQKCFYSGDYKALFNDKYYYQPGTETAYSKRFVLQNGVAVTFWSNGSGCPDSVCGAIFVDLNAAAPPNKGGVDYFEFIIGPNRVSPLGLITKANSWGEQCKYNSNSNKNGPSCTAWVIEKGNMDYLRRDITQEWADFKSAQ